MEIMQFLFLKEFCSLTVNYSINTNIYKTDFSHLVVNPKTIMLKHDENKRNYRGLGDPK